MKKASVLTNGCPENRNDSARMEAFLIKDGWELSQDLSASDLVLFNSCGLSEYSQKDSVDIIKNITRIKKNDALFLVCGCLPKINLERLRKFYSGPVFASDDVDSLKNIIDSNLSLDDIQANYLIPKFSLTKGKFKISNITKIFYILNIDKIVQKILRMKYKETYEGLGTKNEIYNTGTFCIKISTGCLNSCSFCAVKQSRGKLRSKSIESIKNEFSDGMEKGYKEFAFIGTDLGAYGRDIGTNLAGMLKEITNQEGDYKIKLRNVNPKYLIRMMPEMIEVFRSGKISQIGSAIESGSNRILNLMRRGHTKEDYIYAIKYIKNHFPNIKVRTQMLVGFPGETEKEFYDTVDLMEELEFDFIEFYTFSPRPNTEAEKLPNKVRSKIALARKNILFQKFMAQQNRKDRRKYETIQIEEPAKFKLVS